MSLPKMIFKNVKNHFYVITYLLADQLKNFIIEHHVSNNTIILLMLAELKCTHQTLPCQTSHPQQDLLIYIMDIVFTTIVFVTGT